MKDFLDIKSPLFAPGMVWVSNDGGGHKATIVTSYRFGKGQWDWAVIYTDKYGIGHDRDGYNFQVRYGVPQ